MKKHVFGKVNSHMYVIEFQKRGLPHAHILLILEQQDKIKTIDDIDKIVSAEIPDPIIITLGIFFAMTLNGFYY